MGSCTINNFVIKSVRLCFNENLLADYHQMYTKLYKDSVTRISFLWDETHKVYIKLQVGRSTDFLDGPYFFHFYAHAQSQSAKTISNRVSA